VLWRIEQGLFDLIDPRVVVLQVGTNNLKSGDIRRSPAETVKGVRAVVEAIREAEPGARIIVMAILPRQPKYEWIDDAIRETNARLCALQRDMKDVLVVDIGAHFRGQDLQPCRVHMQDDRLHLKPSGYTVWSQCIVDMVDAGLKKLPVQTGDAK
jgi:beta-glucosidase